MPRCSTSVGYSRSHQPPGGKSGGARSSACPTTPFGRCWRCLTEPALWGHIDLERYTATAQELLGLDDEQTVAFMEDIWHEYLGTPNTELIDYFTGLRHRVRTGILSNSFVGAREREQQAYGFEDRCDAIAYSHEIGVMKPDPAAYAAICDLLQVEPHEVVFLDNLEMCVKGAEAVGMRAVLYRENDQAIAEIEAHLATAENH